ncbi:hypothetical protein [Methanobrevibacter smithii]|uniref:hypothetical protein n=1 Tax=Methanobrevibacter smithii TaxID=2173 RepID=UPI001145818B|nr:hypothetical protein [Methanobrevibacter smithii]
MKKNTTLKNPNVIKMTYIVEEIVTPGYIIDRGIYDNPKDAQYRAMEIFVNEGIIEENIKIREVPL